MTTGEPPYAHLLKRLPGQERSRLRVEAILDATAELLAGGDLDRVTVRAVAAAAGVPTGTIYQFFVDKGSLLQALSLRYVAATHGTLDAALDHGEADDWRQDLDVVIEAYATMVRTAPAMRVLWLSGAMDDSTLMVAEEADDTIAGRLGTRLCARVGLPQERADVVGWRVLVTVISALLKQAFARDPVGDPAVLVEARRVARLYASALLSDDC